MFCFEDNAFARFGFISLDVRIVCRSSVRKIVVSVLLF